MVLLRENQGGMLRLLARPERAFLGVSIMPPPPSPAWRFFFFVFCFVLFFFLSHSLQRGEGGIPQRPCPPGESSEAGESHVSVPCSLLELSGETWAPPVRSESALRRISSSCLSPAPSWSFQGGTWAPPVRSESALRRRSSSCLSPAPSWSFQGRPGHSQSALRAL